MLVLNKSGPHSAYFSYPGTSSQAEVFAPSGATARALALHGEITPIR